MCTGQVMVLDVTAWLVGLEKNWAGETGAEGVWPYVLVGTRSLPVSLSNKESVHLLLIDKAHACNHTNVSTEVHACHSCSNTK